MFNKRIVKLISLLLIVLFAFSLSLSVFAEGETEKTTEETTQQQSQGTKKEKEIVSQTVMDEYNNPSGRILCVSKQGDVSSYPENSWQGIKSAIKKGADIVEIDVSKTSDGFLVLMKDEDFTRMCVDPAGNTITSKVSETESWEVIAMCLRQGRGGEASEITEYHPQTLEAVIKAVGDKAVLLINFDSEIREEVFEEVASLGAVDRVIFKFDSQAGAVKKFISAHEDSKVAVMGSYTGNVVFSARKYIKKMQKNSVSSVMLGVKNPNSVIFDKSVLGLFNDSSRAAVDMTNPKKCGEREDNENGWNDLLGRGYSVIETDYPDKLASYIKGYEKEKAALEKLCEKARALDMTKYGYKTSETLKKELENSEKLLAVHTSKLKINEQYSRLNGAIMSLDAADGSTNGRTITAGRVIAALLITALFAFVQVVVYRHSRKDK
ncbi:MAG: glycerophosphodiester phosphodiesterase family protein [Clostridia bacterium]|nr:glycerophosphodiester phosphodiesterase family protein [Clostridia bacterium]